MPDRPSMTQPVRPCIGVTTSLNRADSGRMEQRLETLYVDAVERAGGLPLIVPMLTDDGAADAFAALLDGLVVTGGPAVTDGLVGALPDDISETEPRRLASDRRILDAFLRARRPVLGICYGMQLGNALHGGTLYADVQAQIDGAAVHSSGRGASGHPARVTPGTHLERMAGPALTVNTRHVQALATVGDGLVVSARAPDGVVEAIERPDGSFVGLQFHPEAMDPPLDAVFSDLVTRARRDRAQRG